MKRLLSYLMQWLQAPNRETHPAKSPIRPRAKVRINWDEDEIENQKQEQPMARKARRPRPKSKIHPARSGQRGLRTKSGTNGRSSQLNA